MTQRISMMGCRIDSLAMEQTPRRVAGLFKAGTPRRHGAVNGSWLAKGSGEPELRRISTAGRRSPPPALLASRPASTPGRGASPVSASGARKRIYPFIHL